MNYILEKYKEDNLRVENNNIFLFPWLNHRPIGELVIDLLNDKIENCSVWLLSAEEFEFYPGSVKEIFTDEIKKKLKEKSISFNFLFGSADKDYYIKNDSRQYHQPEHNIYVDLWPTFWLNRTLSSNLKDHNYNYFNGHKIRDFKKNKIKHLYISMNNVGKYHRCLMLDLLAKNDLLDSGAISWRNFCLEDAYDWKHTRPILRTLSDFDNYNKNTYIFQFIPPKEFFESFVSIIAETSIELVFLTEKTATALLYKQPFLVIGAPGFHRFLKSLGFELYTEIFDYSFDEELDPEIRIQMIIDNLHVCKNLDLFKLYTEVKPKLDKNYKRLFEIVKDQSLLPQAIKNHKFFWENYDNDLFR